MSHKKSLSGLAFAAALGSVWGLAEAGLGLALAVCARTLSGSLMTGVSLFFLASARLRTRSSRGPLLAVAVALGFKLFDAALLGLPVRHGTVANPMFAFVVEGAALILFFALLEKKASAGLPGRVLLGAGAALASAAAFPLVSVATGVPACVLAGTSLPLAVVFAPLAAAAGALAVPLAYVAMGRLESWEAGRRPAWRTALPAAAAALSLAVLALLRLA